MLKSLTVENYRGFREKTVLELRPLTILLGRNSSGKSSLTRLIPLIQQSLNRSSATPILWSSDAVDMGNIQDVITHADEALELRIGFRVSAEMLDLHLRRFHFGPANRTSVTKEDEVEYVVRLTADGSRTKFDGITITIRGQTVQMDWDKTGSVHSVLVDGRSYPVERGSITAETSSLFPEITRKAGREEPRSRRTSLYFEPLKDALAEIVHGRTASEKISYSAEMTTFIPKAAAKDFLLGFPNAVSRKVTEAASRRISDLTLINDVARIMTFLRYELEPLFLSAAYIGPSRASGNRFDRIQELAVNRLDASGTNTAMYVWSLNDEERDSFNDLLVRACGHSIQVDESGVGHVSVKIGRVGQPYFENITDVGFGYSQLVPVVAQLHAVRERSLGSDEAESRDVIFAVEQPELHLHPAMQASLADLFVGAINNSTKLIDSTTIVVETHSETFVSQVGFLVAEGSIDPSDVAVYFVDKDEMTGRSHLNLVEYSQDGTIDKWPTGFFSASW